MAGIITDSKKLGGVPQSASRHVAMSTCFDVYLEDSQNIGFISQLTLGHSRTVTQIRHLNSMDAGIAVDSTVTPDTVTLNFNGFYVYSMGAAAKIDNPAASSIVGPTMGRSSGASSLLMTLDQSNIPFNIVVRHASSNGANAISTVIGVYKNCTIQSMSIPLTIGTAAVTDSGVIQVGYVASANDAT